MPGETTVSHLQVKLGNSLRSNTAERDELIGNFGLCDIMRTTS
jgi:hypothetical protein